MSSKLSELRTALRRLAEWPAGETQTVSAYLDLRPQATGQNPQLRSGLIVLRDRLREHERRLEPHTPAHESFVADVARLDEYLNDEALPNVACLCAFANHGAGQRFEALETRHALDNEVSVQSQPRLVPLARLADEEEALVALADSNTLRLFALRSGGLEEVGLLDDEPDDYSRANVGGWSQARFQRHVEEHRTAFAQLAAQAIEEVAGAEHARHVVVCGDEVATPLLIDALPKALAEQVRGVLRVSTSAELADVEAEVLPFMEEVRRTDAHATADRLVAAVRAGGLGVAGARGVADSLQVGQLDEVLVDAEAELDEQTLDDLVRQATATDARVRFVWEHGGLRELGGIGGLQRFSLESDASASQSDEADRGAAVSS